MPEEHPTDARALEEAEDWKEYWRMRAEEQAALVERLRAHAAGQAGEIEDLKNELIETYGRLADLQGRILGA